MELSERDKLIEEYRKTEHTYRECRMYKRFKGDAEEYLPYHDRKMKDAWGLHPVTLDPVLYTMESQLEKSKEYYQRVANYYNRPVEVRIVIRTIQEIDYRKVDTAPIQEYILDFTPAP